MTRRRPVGGKSQRPLVPRVHAVQPRRGPAGPHNPILAITGTKDLQVPAEDLATIHDRAGGGAQTLAVANLTHTLRLQPGPAKFRAYRAEVRGPIAPVVTDTITAWVIKTPTPQVRP